MYSYDISVAWTGNRGTGTSGYRAYDRDHDVNADGRPTIAGSSEPAFRGDRSRWNPELARVSDDHGFLTPDHDFALRVFPDETPLPVLDCAGDRVYDLNYGKPVQEGDQRPAVLVPARDGLGRRQAEDDLRAVRGHRGRGGGAAGRPRGADAARA